MSFFKNIKKSFSQAAKTFSENSEMCSKASDKAIIYKSEWEYISRCILDYPNIETGGQLFGFWTSTGTPVILYAIGPGKNAQHNHTSFIQDQEYMLNIGKSIHSRFRLQHIGDWHSHHNLGLERPSGGDVDSMSYGVGKPGFPRMLLCIGNCDRNFTTLNAYNFHESDCYSYVQASWDIIDVQSPYRDAIETILAGKLIHPHTKKGNPVNPQERNARTDQPASYETHWLTEDIKNVEIFKSFVLEIKALCPDDEIKTLVLSGGEPAISFKKGMRLVKFPYGFPHKSPTLCIKATDNISVEDFTESHFDEQWDSSLPILGNRFKIWVSHVLEAQQATIPAPEIKEETALPGTDQPKQEQEQ